jgi:hypothetical protein
MRFSMAIASICACTLCQYTYGENVQIPRPYWVIVATLVDLKTGERVLEQHLPGTQLQFENAASCESVIHRVPPVRDEGVAISLSCRKAGPAEADL